MIIFLYGEDSFRSTEKLKKIKEEFFKKNTSNASSSVFDFKEKNFSDELKTNIKSKSLFSQNLLVIVKNFLNQIDSSQKDDLIDFLKNNLEDINSSEDMLVFWENENPKKNDKSFKWLRDNVKSIEFLNLNDVQIKKWIEEKFLAFDIKIDENIANKLIGNKNGDLFAIDKEILKIVNFVGDDKLSQDLIKQIDKLINSSIEANIFQTIEYISSGNKKQALKMLHQQIAQGDDPFYILSMYSYQFRNLLKISEFYFQGRTNNFEIAKIIKLHPFVVQKGMQQLKGLDYRKIKEIYQKLEKVDQEAKSGKMSINLGLDLFIAGL
ncbi:MAG: DNA polymerase III subunit delta [Candidatus Moranbacteria bacterium]|jgi:DNA polymerase-3 subunit delta|nr:DNA polymerase III subunit delta [Candidatus Moranbacteria bacterium]